MDDLEEQSPRVEKGACKTWHLHEYYKQFHGRHGKDNDATLKPDNTASVIGEVDNSKPEEPSELSQLRVKWRAIPLGINDQSSKSRYFHDNKHVNSSESDACLESISEGSCPSFEETFEEFFRWREGTGEDSVFAKIRTIFGDRIAFYADYLHFPALERQLQDRDAENETNNSIFSEFGSWEDFVIPPEAVDRDNLTLWLGTKGAHSPLHYDAYCDNYICQVRGIKRWRLWPPNANIISRRIPYEESSIYGEVSLDNKNILPPPAFDILLEEGDLLVLPKHWWHHVETISDESMSVNLWVNRESDQDDRLTEAIVRFAAMGLVDAGSRGLGQGFEGLASWLAPSELESCQGRNVESNNSSMAGAEENSADEDNEEVDREVAVKDDLKSTKIQSGLLNHGENVAYLVDSLLECLDSRGLSDFRNVDPGKVLRLIMNELLQPEAMTRCSDRLLDPAADIWQDST